MSSLLALSVRGYSNKMYNLPMNALAVAVVAVLLLTSGCDGQSASHSSPDDLPDTWLSEMLRATPAQDDFPYPSYLWVANYEGTRMSTAPDGFVGSPIAEEFWEDARHINDLIGLDFRHRDQAVWLHGEFFGIHTGELGDPAQVGARLSDVGYSRGEYKGAEYYYFAADFRSAVDKHPQGVTLYSLVNNVAFLDDGTLVTARHTRDMERIIDAREGLVRSMWEEERWRTLGRTAGDEILGGFLIDPKYVTRPFEAEKWGRGARTGPEILEDWTRYTEGPDA